MKQLLRGSPGQRPLLSFLHMIAASSRALSFQMQSCALLVLTLWRVGGLVLAWLLGHKIIKLSEEALDASWSRGTQHFLR